MLDIDEEARCRHRHICRRRCICRFRC